MFEVVNEPKIEENLKFATDLWIAPDGNAYYVECEGHEGWAYRYVVRTDDTGDRVQPSHLENAGWVHISYHSIVNTPRITRQQRATLEEWFALNKQAQQYPDNHEHARGWGIRVEEYV